MSKVNYATLAASVSSAAAARRALACEDFGVAEEEFLRATWESLGRNDLLTWLGIAEPDEVGGSRPNSGIVARIVEDVGASSLDVILFAEDDLRAVIDPDVRDDLVEALRAKTPVVAGRLRPLLSGGRVFSAVRDAAVRASYAEASLVVDDLMEVRRDDISCLGRLRAALRGPSRLAVLRIVVDAKMTGEVGDLRGLVGDIPLLHGMERSAEAANLLAFATSWPEVEERRAFFIGRALTHGGTAESWASIYWEMPAELRDDVGLASAATDRPAPWSLASVVRNVTEAGEAWRLALKLITEAPNPRATSAMVAASDVVDDILGRRTSADELKAALQDVPRSRHCQVALVARLPVPPDADDRFDDVLVSAFTEHPDLMLDRLLQLPRSRARAVRIFDLAIKLRRLWGLEGLDELADLVGPLPGPVPIPLGAEQVPIFRVLVGPDRADAELEQELRRRLREEDINEALHIARLEPSLGAVSRAELRQLVLATPVSTLCAIQQQEPWLLSTDDVVAEASRRTGALGHIDLLPGYLAPVIEARAATTTHVSEATQLLTRMQQLGAKRDALLGVVVERMKTLGPAAVDPGWVGQHLGSRSAWDQHGAALVDALLAPPSRAGVAAFMGIVLSAPVEEKSRESLSRAVHTVMSQFLIRSAGSSIEESDHDGARRALTALAHLSPRSGIQGTVEALERRGPSDVCRELIRLNGALLKRKNSEHATLTAIRDALVALLGDEETGVNA